MLPVCSLLLDLAISILIMAVKEITCMIHALLFNVYLEQC